MRPAERCDGDLIAHDARALAAEIAHATRFAGAEIGRICVLGPLVIACTVGLLALLGAACLGAWDDGRSKVRGR